MGIDVEDRDFLPFTDVEESVRDDMAILRQSLLIPDDVVINGVVYNVDTGHIIQVFLTNMKMSNLI